MKKRKATKRALDRFTFMEVDAGREVRCHPEPSMISSHAGELLALLAVVPWLHGSAQPNKQKTAKVVDIANQRVVEAQSNKIRTPSSSSVVYIARLVPDSLVLFPYPLPIFKFAILLVPSASL